MISLDNLTVSYGGWTLFDNISFLINPKDRIGLVGRNGAGKTTLLRIITGEQQPTSGSVTLNGDCTIGYLPQTMRVADTTTLVEETAKAFEEVLRLEAEIEHLTREIAERTDYESDGYAQLLHRLNDAQDHYHILGGETRDADIEKTLLGLGFKREDFGRPTSEFSGGWRMRIELAKLLLRRPSIFLLDEPTNHLDIVMTQWLEKYLQEFKGGLLVVSHDRAFLDNVAMRIMEMEGGKLQSFKGNYSRYLEQKAIQSSTLTAAYNAQQDYIARTEAYIRRFKAGIKSKMARGRQSQLDRLERIDAPVQHEEFELRLPPAAECADRVLIMEDLTIGYGEKILAKGINLTLRRGEKAALLGANGTGKTTLLRTILGEIAPLKGKAKIGSRVQIGYFSQSYERLNPEQTLLENFVVEYGFTEEHTRSMLGGMLFHGDDVFKKIGELSGGQKARLVLLKLVLDGANCLVLDEPTNHLDIMAREAVEAALESFDGTVLVVSHDRYFVNEVADRIWEIEDLEVKDYKGNYDFYLEEKQKKAAALAQAQEEAEKAAAYAEAQVKKQQQTAAAPVKEKKQEDKKRRYSPDEAARLLPKVELQIREQEAMMGLLEKQMADPANHTSPEHSAAMAAEHEEYEQTIAELMEKWELLMEAAEDA